MHIKMARYHKPTVSCVKTGMVSCDCPCSDSDGTVDDSVYFILVNFAEMNKLWIQYQEECQGKEQLEEEQMELCILVGTNLVRLSQLEGIDVDKYKIVCGHI